MRLVFAGSPDVAVPTLRALHDAGHDIALVAAYAGHAKPATTALYLQPTQQDMEAAANSLIEDRDGLPPSSLSLGQLMGAGRR